MPFEDNPLLNDDQRRLSGTDTVGAGAMIPVGRWAFVIGAVLLVTWLGRPLIGAISEDYWSRASSAPQGLLVLFKLYILAPAVVLCTLFTLLAPAAVFLVVAGAARSWTALPAQALCLSLPLLAVSTSLVKLFAALTPIIFLLTIAVLDAVGLLVALFRMRRGRCAPVAVVPAAFQRRCLWAALLVGGLLIALMPKFFWENFNDDGIQALECGRLLSTQHLPIWDAETNKMYGFPGITTLAFVFPVSWFVQLYGPYEIAARAPHLLYLIVLFFAVLDLIEMGARRAAGVGVECAVALALATYTVAMAYSASYDPYSADIAQPGARETLLLAMFLGACAAYWSHRNLWFIAFAFATFTSSPSGMPLLALLGILGWFSGRKSRSSHTAWMLVALSVCALGAFAWKAVAGPSEHSAGYLARRLLFWHFTDVKRLLILLVPCGFLPIIALLRPRRREALGWLLSLVCLIYFAFFYAQAFVALHYFAPAMVLPVIVFWRSRLQAPTPSRWPVPLAITGCCVALWLSLPRDLVVKQSMRALGQQTDLRIGHYSADFQPTLERAAALFASAFTLDWDLMDPATEWGGQPAAWLYYASRPKRQGTQVQFLAQPAFLAPPEGFRKLGGSARDVLYVCDMGAFQQWRSNPPRADYAAFVYRLPRTTLFRHFGERANTMDMDLRPFVRRWIYDPQ